VELNDELLCAYLDDELDPSQREQVAAAIAADAGAKLRLARMTSADHRLQNAMKLPGEDHFQVAMAARIQNSIPIPRRSRMILPWAAAAAISGVAVGFFASSALQSPAAEFTVAGLTSGVMQVLQTAPSGLDANNLRVVLTFMDDRARYCRVFHAKLPGASGEGLACRESGNWSLQAWDATAGSSDTYQTAGASGTIDTVMNKLGGSAVLDASAEAALIKRGWTVLTDDPVPAR
jgi:hypothetical protein